MQLGLPDQAFIGLAEIAEATGRMRDAVALPLIVDADTGFGNAVNVRHAVRVLERAGADAVQLEDQVSPKRCGHFSGKAVVDCAEMVGKIHAAVDARADSGLLVMARTDARAVHGFEAAIERAQAYAEAGADILFVEAPESAAEIRALPGRLQAPLLMNMVIGGRTPLVDSAELQALGYAIVLYANAALQGALAGMQRALQALLRDGQLAEDPALVASFAERQRLVGKAEIDAWEQRYGRHPFARQEEAR
jgi:2-methylisocitrate lyase-like PEP mutase family enzyme